MHYVDEGAGDAGAPAPRRADVGVPLPEDDPDDRRRGARRRARTTSASAARTSRRGSRTTRTTSTTTSIERFADELDLRDVTVVVQDWGGPIGLRLAVERPDRVARLVILNTGVGAGRAPSRGVAALPRVRAARRHGPRARASSSASPASTELADEVVEGYNAPFPTPESKAGVLAFPELVPTELGPPERREDDRGARRARAAGSARRSSSSPTPTRSSRRAPPSAWPSGSPAPARPRRSPAQATSCRRRRARRSPSGSSASSRRPVGEPGVGLSDSGSRGSLSSRPQETVQVSPEWSSAARSPSPALLARRLELLAHEVVVDRALDARGRRRAARRRRSRT